MSSSKVLILDVIPIMNEVAKEGQVVKLSVKAFNPDTGDPTTLSSPSVTIYDPDDVIQAGPTAPTQNTSLTNEYVFYFMIPALPTRGTWRAEFSGSIASRTHIVNQKFEVS